LSPHVSEGEVVGVVGPSVVIGAVVPSVVGPVGPVVGETVVPSPH